MHHHAVHNHAVGFYRDDHDLVGSIVPFLGEALDHGGAALVIATPEHRRGIEGALSSSGHSIEALTESGHYRAADADATLASFVRAGVLDRDEFESVIGGMLAEVAPDCGPVHAFGEMVSRLWDAGAVSAAIELESFWNDLAATHAFSLYCAYALSSFERSRDLGAAKQVCDQHSSVITLDRSAGRASAPAAPARRTGCTRVFIPARSAASDVRSFVREALQGQGVEDLLEEAQLVASELATNAVLHARSPFEVSISCTDPEITIAVRDVSTDLPEHVTDSADRNGGRGIALIATLAQAWETHPDTSGKTISATLARRA